MKREQELLRWIAHSRSTGKNYSLINQQIERMKEDFEQERQGYNLMLRIKDEEISRLKEMLNDKSGSNTDR